MENAGVPRTNFKLRVTMENEAGELDSAVVTSEEAAAVAMVEMIERCGHLNGGDVFRVREVE